MPSCDVLDAYPSHSTRIPAPIWTPFGERGWTRLVSYTAPSSNRAGRDVFEGSRRYSCRCARLSGKSETAKGLFASIETCLPTLFIRRLPRPWSIRVSGNVNLGNSRTGWGACSLRTDQIANGLYEHRPRLQRLQSRSSTFVRSAGDGIGNNDRMEA